MSLIGDQGHGHGHGSGMCVEAWLNINALWRMDLRSTVRLGLAVHAQTVRRVKRFGDNYAASPTLSFIRHIFTTADDRDS